MLSINNPEPDSSSQDGCPNTLRDTLVSKIEFGDFPFIINQNFEVDIRIREIDQFGKEVEVSFNNISPCPVYLGNHMWSTHVKDSTITIFAGPDFTGLTNIHLCSIKYLEDVSLAFPVSKDYNLFAIGVFLVDDLELFAKESQSNLEELETQFLNYDQVNTDNKEFPQTGFNYLMVENISLKNIGESMKVSLTKY